jgi:hypothetical protein
MGGPTGGTAAACLELGTQGIAVRHEREIDQEREHRTSRYSYRTPSPRTGYSVATISRGNLRPARDSTASIRNNLDPTLLT